MKICHLILLLCLSHATIAADAPMQPPTDKDLTGEVQSLSKRFTRLTDQPLSLAPYYAFLCSPPDGLAHSPHDNRFVHIYVSTNAASIAMKGEGIYPVGTIVLKEKLLTADGKRPELFTGMIKREKGYNPAAGDWEFFTASGDASRITARGKIDSCIDCHSSYAKTDYLTQSWNKKADRKHSR